MWNNALILKTRRHVNVWMGYAPYDPIHILGMGETYNVYAYISVLH